MAKRRDKRAATFRTVVIFVIIFIVGGFALVRLSERGGDSDLRATLAQCLSDNGAVMYGAYWCPNCSNQKKDFGKAFSKVEYVECAVPGNPRAQNEECQEAGIEGYPTWVFADGSELVGRQSLEDIADAAGCPWGTEDMMADDSDGTVLEASSVEEGEAMEGDSEEMTEDDGAMMEDGAVDGEETP